MVDTRSRRWVFTLNNPTDDEKAHIADHLSGVRTKYAVVGREVGASGTPHLQGFVIYHGPTRFNAVRGFLGGRCHLERARGTSAQARAYCQKDGDFDEYGQFPEAQGHRSDLDQLIEWADNFFEEEGRPATSPDIAKHKPQAYIKYPRFTRLCERRATKRALQFGEPQPWQSQLSNELLMDADDRTIKFYVDSDGGKGKTWFCRWFMTEYPDKVQVLSVGKRDDIAHAIDETKTIFLFNIPRNGLEFLNFSILESLKDRMVFSPKYNSGMKLFNKAVHVVVFTNEEPERTLTDDRYEIVNL